MKVYATVQFTAPIKIETSFRHFLNAPEWLLEDDDDPHWIRAIRMADDGKGPAPGGKTHVVGKTNVKHATLASETRTKR